MLPIAAARTDKKSDCIESLPGDAGEDNVAWLQRAAGKVAANFGQRQASSGHIRLVLLGGTDPVSFRLRVAQAHVRHDLTPSSWSHVVLCDPREAASVHEISLEPPAGFRYPVPNNGLQQGTIEAYRDRALYPNIALIGIRSTEKLTWEKIDGTFKQFQKQRTALDGIELIVRWLAFVWGAGRAGNPLLEGFGIPSAAMLEVVFSALGYDLTPGLESRSSCPEAIWQAVNWWHDYYGPAGIEAPRCVHRVDHRLVPESAQAMESAALKHRVAEPPSASTTAAEPTARPTAGHRSASRSMQAGAKRATRTAPKKKRSRRS
ncbi:MAG: hypothetical protein P0111_01175 [Nitrospira sp.]|nr:hypothetical protein [Nitrospira sp.]